VNRINRRSFLSAAIGGVGLAALRQGVPKIRGVIWLWMDGGMSSSTTWDPKPLGKVKAMATAVADIQISEWMTICATQIRHLSIIRSVTHGFFDQGLASWAMHAAPHNGFQTDLPLIGTILTHELGAKDCPLPSHLVLDGPDFPEAPVFGDRALPFHLQTIQNPLPNIRRNVDATRDRERADLLLAQNKDWGGLRQQREAARVEDGILVSERLMNTPLLRTFNLLEEPLALREEYGAGFGQSCLLARRLIQAGCSFIEVGLQGWDTRATPFLVPLLDKALGTLIQDLAGKSLLKDTLVVCATPFGRGPAVGEAPSPRGFSVALAGGSLAGGRVYGDTGPDGDECRSPVSIKSLFATIYRACGVDGEKEYLRDGRKLKYLSGGKPVEELF